jgi:ABC-type nickel/cobalt efflux system permease component RcnA
METVITAQRWLYAGIANGLGEFGKGDPRAIFAATAAAVFFGAIHALMPGHGKTIFISYHLGQPGKLRDGIANGAILAVTHVGQLAIVLVLAGFAVISKVFAVGGRTPQFELASGLL